MTAAFLPPTLHPIRRPTKNLSKERLGAYVKVDCCGKPRLIHRLCIGISGVVLISCMTSCRGCRGSTCWTAGSINDLPVVPEVDCFVLRFPTCFLFHESLSHAPVNVHPLDFRLALPSKVIAAASGTSQVGFPFSIPLKPQLCSQKYGISWIV
ncbi:hypothetical protein EDD17DRAFT_50954 [Pisolithus thermaeus]|nr:hypothetical protein EDD17DRAFT_50954 [Pisolithus thermaeus]